MNFDQHGCVQMTAMDYAPGRAKAANPVKVQDLTFRDGHQSLFATRGRTEDMLAVAEQMDKVGFYSMEVWGGATFDTMHRYLNEDPWERIRTLKKVIINTPFQMLLRGQNLVGYRNYPDDVAENFVQRACDNGIDIFRVFDALNDYRNFDTCVKVIKRNHKHFQGTICYSLTEKRMGGDIYTIEYYLEKARQLQDMGADSIAIKDMAGLVSPYDAYNLVKALKDTVKIPINLHTHFTSGMGDLALLKAIEAGVDIIDTCLSPYAYRSSHPAIEPLVCTLYGTNRDTGFDLELLAKISNELEKSAPKYMQFLDQTKLSVIDINVLLHQTPGGMLSNLVSQLKQMDALDKLDKVFSELPKVRKDLGMVPLVTPTSQIVGTQTVNNVLFDSAEEGYQKITEQVKDLCYGLYGHTPRPLNPQVQAKALNGYPRGNQPITCRPADILEPEMPQVVKDSEGLAKDLDDQLIVALYPVTGKRFLKWKYGMEPAPADVKPVTMDDVNSKNELVAKALAGKLVEKKPAPEKPEHLRKFNVYVNDEYFEVEVAADGAATVSVAQPVSVPRPAAAPAPTAPKKAAAPAAPAVTAAPGESLLTAPIPGMIAEYKKQVGDKVEKGETVVVLEAMKMLNNLDAPVAGTITKISYNAGDSVAKGDVLCVIG